MEFQFSVISGKTVDEVISRDYDGAIERVRQAYLLHEAGQSVNPNSYFLRFPEKPNSRIIALPAHLGGAADVTGIKWISSFPDNIRRGFPRASAVLILNDTETGYPLACMESSIVSAVRTAASAVLAADHLVAESKTAGTVAFVGNGLIARHVYQVFMGSGWSFEEVALFDLNRGDSDRFASEVCLPGRHGVRVCDSLEDAVRSSDLVVLATTAGSPYIHEPSWFAHDPVVLNISLRDLAPELLLSSNNVVDDIDHVMNADTSPHLAEKLCGNRGFVNGTIGQLVQGECSLAARRPTIFSPFGMGILDLAIAKWVYEEALRTGRAAVIEDFFHELVR